LEPLDESDLTQWAVTLTPEKGSLYEGGKFKLSATVGDRYPIQPPTFRFITPVCHPNVHATTGEICLDVLKDECVAPDVHSLTALTHCTRRLFTSSLPMLTRSLHSFSIVPTISLFRREGCFILFYFIFQCVLAYFLHTHTRMFTARILFQCDSSAACCIAQQSVNLL
jgi:hypothetical protein